MRAKAEVKTPTDDITVDVTLTGSLAEFRKLRGALTDGLPFWQVMSIVEAIDDVTTRVTRQIVGDKIVTPRPMVEGDL